MAYTDGGFEWVWKMLLGQVRNEDGGLSDQLASARLVVGDGSRDFQGTDVRLAGENTAYAELDDGYPQLQSIPGGVALVLRATFDEQTANFEWREKGLTSARGVLIDRTVGDQGRKAPGTRWTAEVVLELVRDDGED